MAYLHGRCVKFAVGEHGANGRNERGQTMQPVAIDEACVEQNVDSAVVVEQFVVAPTVVAAFVDVQSVVVAPFAVEPIDIVDIASVCEWRTKHDWPAGATIFVADDTICLKRPIYDSAVAVAVVMVVIGQQLRPTNRPEVERRVKQRKKIRSVRLTKRRQTMLAQKQRV